MFSSKQFILPNSFNSTMNKKFNTFSTIYAKLEYLLFKIFNNFHAFFMTVLSIQL